MIRGTGQSLVLSNLCGGCQVAERLSIEVRVSEVCAEGTTVLEVLLPDNMFVERKETLDGMEALFPAHTPEGAA
jgi:hypothetical protein